MKDIVIVSAKRTPIGSFQGALSSVAAPELGATAIQAAIQDLSIAPEQFDECLMGCVLPAGLGQAPARQASKKAGLPDSVRATTINRVCSSGLKTVMMAEQTIKCGDANWIVAGGMENMSQAPYLLPKARTGYRLGDGQLVDSMVHDGLWDVYNDYHMGKAAELCAQEKSVDRESQDNYAKESYERALAAIESGKFKNEITTVSVASRKETLQVDEDEEPGRGRLDKFSSLKTVFEKDGTVTAANASSLSDGAAALVVCSLDDAKKNNLTPMARIVAQASHAQAPEWFTTAPIGAVEKVLSKAQLSIRDIDLFEINEAFSVVALACLRGLDIDPKKVNVHGGAVALGHPLGASGARILVTLIHALQDQKKKYGIATLCIGGGEASAVLVENLSA